MKKRILSVLITVVMLIGMLPTAVFAAETTYDIRVGGVQVTSANKDNIVVPDANGSAKYDPTTNTLTLNNFSYTNAAGVDAIISDGMNLTIVLKGENAFSVGGMGICVENGTLTISDSDEDDTVGSLEMISGLDAFAPAIYSGGSISIDGVELLAACDGASSTRTDPTFAIFSETVSIKDSTVTVRVLNVQNGLAIMASTLTVKNSTVEANGTYGAILDSATFSHSGVSGLVPTLNGDHVVYAGNDNTASSVGDDAKDDAATYANKYVKIEPVKYDLYIGGVQFTSGNLIIDSTDSTAISGSATYTPELNTLTLNNFQYSGPGYKNDEYEYLYGALRVEGDNDLRIVFTGQNVIECTNGDERWGLYTDFIGDLHIKAETIDSCLTFIGGDVACGRVPVFDGNFVIYAGDNEADAKITAEDTFASQYYTYSYVRYEPTLMVTFDYGTLGSETKTVFKDETVTPPAPAFAGKVLVGWYTDSNFTTEFNFSDAITANKTIYAKFTAAVAKIEKTGTSGLVDTYTITYTDGTTTIFTVTNGEKGDKGDQGIQGIQGVSGADGHTPVITIQNGYWYIDGVNTNQAAQGVKGETGNGISDISKTGTSGLVDTYTITYTNGTTTTFTVTNGEKGDKGDQGIQGIQGVPGADGHTPIITIQNGFWYIDGVNTNQVAQGVKGDKGDKGDTGATGATGAQGPQGEKGDKGNTGAAGADGVGISNIEKTSSDGNVDTYTITLTNGTTYTFTVTNGTNGTDGKDGKDGTNGKDGVDGKDGTNGTNGVDGKDGANGADGQTPYIGENGNWWIGDTDTGVKAAGDDGKDGAITVATAVGGTALTSNIALIAWALIKKKRLF